MNTLSTYLIAALIQAGGPLDTDEGERYLEPTRLDLKTLDWDTRSGQPKIANPLSYTKEEAEQAGYYFVQGEVEKMPALAQQIRDAGGLVFDYIPHNAFEAWLPKKVATQLRAAGRRMVAVEPAMKVDPDFGSFGTSRGDASNRALVTIELWPNRVLEDEALRLEALGIEIVETVVTSRHLRLLTRLSVGDMITAAHQPGVKWIEESQPASQRNDKSRWVIQTNTDNDVKLWQLGVTGANVGIGHIDGGRIHENSCYFDDPSGANVGPTHRKIKWWANGGGTDAHSTHTAGSAAGDSRPITGGLSGSGMAPDAYLVHHPFFPNNSNFLNMLSQSHQRGARIHTNSWGNDGSTSYTNWCRDIDVYSHDAEDGVVLFAVTNGSRLKTPENAKSCVGVGATDKGNPEQHGSGGTGPTSDRRLKPEVYAPGCSTSSADSRNGCGLRSMCGTSMACPVVAGGAALLKQYFEDGFYPSGVATPADARVPSGSLLRACLANSGDDMSGVSGYPSYKEGWGRILLDNVAFFQGDSRRLWVADVLHASGLSQGQTQSAQFTVQNGGELRVTMAFADEPGSAFANAPVVNNLNLIVRAPNGTEYHGNILRPNQGGASKANPNKFDPRNTMETVIVPNPANGVWTVEVVGANVPVGPQGYAVVATY